MSKLRFNITMSLDGYVAGPNQSVKNPLGEGGEKLHEWAVSLRTFRAMHGMEGGSTGPDDAIVAENFENIGATIMGRHMFGGGDGPWGDDPWRGWWGNNPPFHTPVFVLTHHAREPLEMEGGTKFHFVTAFARRSIRRAARPAVKTSTSAAAPPSHGSTCGPRSSTRWTFTSSLSFSAMERVFLKTPTRSRPSTSVCASSARRR